MLQQLLSQRSRGTRQLARAEVGNTGDSYGAYLHFQVNDSPDLLRGRSLRFTFAHAVELAEAGQFIRTAK